MNRNNNVIRNGVDNTKRDSKPRRHDTPQGNDPGRSVGGSNHTRGHGTNPDARPNIKGGNRGKVPKDHKRFNPKSHKGNNKGRHNRPVTTSHTGRPRMSSHSVDDITSVILDNDLTLIVGKICHSKLCNEDGFTIESITYKNKIGVVASITRGKEFLEVFIPESKILTIVSKG